jgi:hypothetical protein
MTHYIKIWPVYFDAVLDGRKRFEVRRNDRGYREGDLLTMREWNPETFDYTGRETTVEIAYMQAGIGLADGYVVLGIERVP